MRGHIVIPHTTIDSAIFTDYRVSGAPVGMQCRHSASISI